MNSNMGRVSAAGRPLDMVREFHRVFGLSMAERPALPDEDLMRLRLDLISEELGEMAHALSTRDLVAVADALGDIVYVTYGAAVSFGIPLDDVLAEIHRSNMSKLDTDGSVILSERGKVLKGPNYSPPDLRPVIMRTYTGVPAEDGEASLTREDHEKAVRRVLGDDARWCLTRSVWHHANAADCPHSEHQPVRLA